MNDLISRQAAINAVMDEFKRVPTTAIRAKTRLESLPAAQPQRMRGRWIKSDTDGFVCSVCRNGYKMQPTIMGEPMFEFCPCCGAYMRGGEQDE